LTVPFAVVDASVVVGLLLGWIAPAALGVELDGLHSPAHMDAEVLHALMKLERRDAIGDGDARIALDRLVRAPILRIPIEGLPTAAWELRHNLSGYDALYVELARRLACPLITADRRLAAAPALGVPITVV